MLTKLQRNYCLANVISAFILHEERLASRMLKRMINQIVRTSGGGRGGHLGLSIVVVRRVHSVQRSSDACIQPSHPHSMARRVEGCWLRSACAESPMTDSAR